MASRNKGRERDFERLKREFGITQRTTAVYRFYVGGGITELEQLIIEPVAHFFLLLLIEDFPKWRDYGSGKRKITKDVFLITDREIRRFFEFYFEEIQKEGKNILRDYDADPTHCFLRKRKYNSWIVLSL